jgi:hypothetical protein
MSEVTDLRARANGASLLVPPADATTASDDAEPRKFKLSDYKYKATSTGAAFRHRLTIPEGKPGPDTFFRIDPRPEMQEEVCILDYKRIQDNPAETYLVIGDLADTIGKRAKPALLRVCVCRPAIVRVWALKVPAAVAGRPPNGYVATAWEAAAVAESRWVRMESNESRTGYDIIEAEANWPDPEWPTESLDELVEKAFNGRFITTPGHEVLAALRGKA